MAIVCRTARSSDLDDINVLFQSAERGALPFTKRQEIVFKRLLEEQTVDLLVVEKDEYIVGCCHCAIIPTLAQGGRSYAVLSHFMVDPLNRKQGIANQLLEFSVAEAKKRGCYQVMVAIDSVQPWQHRYFQRKGFQQFAGMFVYGQ